MRWAVFLDRDGTINEEIGLISRPDQLKLIPGAAAAVKRLKAAGALLVIITNQSVVARGIIGEDELGRIHARLKELLSAEDAAVDAVIHCPHHPGFPPGSGIEERPPADQWDPRFRKECDCRKPKPGMLLSAAERFGIDLERSYMVGDGARDMGAAREAGCRAVLVRTGHGGGDGTCEFGEPDAVVDDLAGAADWILEQAGG